MNAISTKPITFDPEQCAAALSALTIPGAVMELQMLNPKQGRGTASGYFQDPAKLVQEARKLSGGYAGVYITLNPVKPDLLARSAHRVNRYAQTTTSDTDILARRWLPIDLDPPPSDWRLIDRHRTRRRPGTCR